jgi:hypothetical protein
MANTWTELAEEELEQLRAGTYRDKINALSDVVFRNAIKESRGLPAILNTYLAEFLHHPRYDVRHHVPKLASELVPDWPDLFGYDLSDQIVLSLADSYHLCAEYAARAVFRWHRGQVSTSLLQWAKDRIPIDASVLVGGEHALPSVPMMLKELPMYAQEIKRRRDFPSCGSFWQNEIRLHGGYRGVLRCFTPER